MDKYLLPAAIKSAGLESYNESNKFTISSEMREYIIHNYSRSPGVRGLKKYINKICERIAFKIVEAEAKGGE